MNQSFRALILSSAAQICGVFAVFGLGTSALAQSAGALATSPYVPLSSTSKPAPQPAAEGCVCAARQPVKAAEPAAKPAKPTPPAPSASSGPILPIVMFRGTPAPPLPKPAFVSMQAVPLALPPETTPASVPAPPPPWVQPIATPAAAPAAPPAAKPRVEAKREKPAGPFKRIWRDTKKSVVTDIPEALADSLPWVDRGDKDEPIEQVLARVSADLSRASAHDPEWVNPAESELRELSKRLSTLAEPAADTALNPMPTPRVEVDAAGRPFRPRPIWPGASGRPEAQSRPTALVTGSSLQQGPEALGQRLPPPTDWVEEEEKGPKPPPQQVIAKRAKRPTK